MAIHAAGQGVVLVHFATQVAVFFNIFVNPIALAAIARVFDGENAAVPLEGAVMDGVKNH